MKLPDLDNLKVDIDEICGNRWMQKDITVSMLRLDEISSHASGNKIFKLYGFIQSALRSNQAIITFGGAYSNHLAATAQICRAYRLNCTGIVRGERPATLSHTLSYCEQNGMQLVFVSREVYRHKEDPGFLKELAQKFGDHILIPEGGFSAQGVEGASRIGAYTTGKSYTHICCPVGTATTLAGLITSAKPFQRVLGFDALKQSDTNERLSRLSGGRVYENYGIMSSYHFGGYAKKSRELIDFINAFYRDHAIPLDFVYTGKMMFGVVDLIVKDYFPPGSAILCIHTGGLQGNASLPAGMLDFH